MPAIPICQSLRFPSVPIGTATIAAGRGTTGGIIGGPYGGIAMTIGAIRAEAIETALIAGVTDVATA